MATGKGYEGILGVVKESTWGTEVAVTQKVPVTAVRCQQTYQPVPNKALLGVHGANIDGRGAADVSLEISAHLHYGMRLFLLEQFMAGYTDEVSGADHYDYTDNSEGKSLTVAWQEGVSVHAVTGFKPNEFILTGTPADGVMMTFRGMFQDRLVGSATNTTAVLNALSDPTKHALYSGEFTLHIADIGQALATTYKPAGFTLTLNRNQTNAIVNDREPLEPIENDECAGSLELNFPRHTTDYFLTNHNTYVPMFAKLVIGDGTNSKEFRLNRMLVIEDPTPPVEGKGLLTPTVRFKLFHDKGNTNAHADFPFTALAAIYES